jgi:hypothetical protein
MLKSLKLHGMAQALGDLAAQDSPAYQSAVDHREIHDGRADGQAARKR